MILCTKQINKLFKITKSQHLKKDQNIHVFLKCEAHKDSRTVLRFDWTLSRDWLQKFCSIWEQFLNHIKSVVKKLFLIILFWVCLCV